MFLSINPFNEEVLFNKAYQENEKLLQSISALNQEQILWAQLKWDEKQLRLSTLALALADNQALLSQMITLEIGKNIHESEAEVQKCIDTLNYYIKQAPSFLHYPIVTNPPLTGLFQYEPMGLIFAVMPWNFPIWQCMRVIIPALIVGNGILIKPAPNAGWACSKLIEIINNTIRLNITNIAWCDLPQIATIVSHPHIKACTLTGSEIAGSTLAQLAGKYLKKCVLELGGSDPFIVFDDTDLNQVTDNALKARLQNNGQSCIAAKRFIIHKNIYEIFKHTLIQKLEDLGYENPLTPMHSIGPLARLDLKEKLSQQVTSAIEAGATIVYQSQKKLPNQNFFPYTILENLNPELAEHREELFGPVFQLYSFDTIETAVSIANHSPYGLGASVWSQDPKRAHIVAQKLEVGNVFINSITRSDAAFAFGGMKHSGYGKELGKEGLLEFAHLKCIQSVID